MLIAEYAEDLEKWRQGAPVYIPTEGGQITFYLRRWGTPESEKRLKRIKQALFGPMHRETGEDSALVFAHWLADYGVVRWDDFESEGETVKHSQSRARELFLDERYFYSLNQMLINEALNYETFLYEQIEEAADEIKKP